MFSGLSCECPRHEPDAKGKVCCATLTFVTKVETISSEEAMVRLKRWALHAYSKGERWEHMRRGFARGQTHPLAAKVLQAVPPGQFEGHDAQVFEGL